jgi:hypothetical protein
VLGPFLGLVTVAVAATAAGPVPFRTVGHGSAGGMAPKRAAVLVASDATGAGRIAALVGGPTAARVRAVDLNADTLVAAFAGAKPTSGYAIQIRRLVLGGPALDVVVTLRSPPPGGNSLPAVTTPYHVVQIARDRGASVRRWRLVTTGGRVLARGSLSATR